MKKKIKTLPKIVQQSRIRHTGHC
uniref:Uncharacterized protein n=1 Tax=Anopheles quadriannulatus TaxID=34691 RepID=A0A182X1S5_ANOQN